LFLSHPHWDHIQGFPFFVPAYAPTTTVNVHGGEKTRKVLSGQMDSEHFPVRFTDLGANILAVDFVNEQAQAGDITVKRFAQRHPGGSSGFVFEAAGVRVAYCTDHELDELLADPEAAKSKPDELRKFVDGALEAYEDVDLLIADAQYLDAEYAKKTGWGHPRAETVVDAAIAAGAKKLALYHHDPLQTDADVDAKVKLCADRARRLGSELFVFAAREGVELLFGE
jgi:phosphoribosyl 1,2-cyclic phosphodiesterase